MRVASDELARRLTAENALPKLVLLNGNEPLFIEETLDAARQALKKQGFTERLSYQLEAGFDWSLLSGAGQSMSMFAERQLFELRVPKSLGAAGTKALVELSDMPPDDNLLIVVMPLLDKRQRGTKWFKTVEAKAWVVDVHDVRPAQFSAWIKQRLQSRALRVEAGVVDMLSQQLEGNVLAAAQEIDKLKVLSSDGSVTLALLQQSLADQARFDVYALVDASLLGEFDRFCRIKQRLQSEGVEPVIVVWALVREIRVLVALTSGLQRGQQRSSLFKEHRIWRARETVINGALSRLNLDACHQLLRQAAHLDQATKGARFLDVGDTWYQIEQLGAALCGVDACSIRAVQMTSNA